MLRYPSRAKPLNFPIPGKALLAAVIFATFVKVGCVPHSVGGVKDAFFLCESSSLSMSVLSNLALFSLIFSSSWLRSSSFFKF